MSLPILAVVIARRKPAALIAGVLYRDFRRERDDATAIVFKQGLAA